VGLRRQAPPQARRAHRSVAHQACRRGRVTAPQTRRPASGAAGGASARPRLARAWQWQAGAAHSRDGQVGTQAAGAVRAGGGEEGGGNQGENPPPHRVGPRRNGGRWWELRPPRHAHAAARVRPRRGRLRHSATQFGGGVGRDEASGSRRPTLRGRDTNLQAVEDGVGARLTTLVATLAGTVGRQHPQKNRCWEPRPPPRPFAAGRLCERGAVAGGGDGPGREGHPVKQPAARAAAQSGAASPWWGAGPEPQTPRVPGGHRRAPIFPHCWGVPAHR